MGLGFYGRRRSRARIETLLKHLLASGEIEDPLLRFTRQLETATLDADTETVNLIPLFTCRGAAAEAVEQAPTLASCFAQRQRNLTLAALTAESCGWEFSYACGAIQDRCANAASRANSHMRSVCEGIARRVC